MSDETDNHAAHDERDDDAALASEVDALSGDEDESGPLVSLRSKVAECYGVESAYLSAFLLTLLTMIPLTAGWAWHRGWCTGGQAWGYGALSFVVVPIAGAVLSTLFDSVAHKVVSWPLSVAVLAAGWGAALRWLGGGVTEALGMGGGMALFFGLSTVGFWRDHRRTLRELAVPDPLADALMALQMEPEPPMVADLDEAVQGFVDVRETVRGALKGEPGVAGERILADAAAVLTAALKRAPVVDRLLTRTSTGEVSDDAWATTDGQWRALVDELNETAEALLSYAAQQDAASRRDLDEHQAHLARLRDAHAELS